LKAAGYSLNTGDSPHFRAAYQQLLALNPAIVSYDYVLTEVTRDSASPIHVALAYSGDHYTLNDVQGVEDWQFVTPEEGTSIWVDCVAILATSKQQPQALAFLAFLAFLNRPEMAALNAEQVWLATPNEQALPLIDAELLSDDTVYQDLKTLSTSESYENIEADNTLQRSRMLRALMRHHEAQ